MVFRVQEGNFDFEFVTQESVRLEGSVEKVLFEKVLLEKVLFEKVLFEKVLVDKVLFEKVLFEKVLFEKVLFEKVLVEKVSIAIKLRSTSWLEISGLVAAKVFSFLKLLFRTNLLQIKKFWPKLKVVS